MTPTPRRTAGEVLDKIMGHLSLGKEHKHCGRVAAIEALTEFAREAQEECDHEPCDQCMDKFIEQGAASMRERAAKIWDHELQFKAPMYIQTPMCPDICTFCQNQRAIRALPLTDEGEAK